MSAHEIAEHLEHAAHHGHGGQSSSAKYIGITMAVLGVMLAFCSAMVGGQRTELIKSMVEQSTRSGLYQTETMKYRVMASNFELLRALSPQEDEVRKVEQTLREKRRTSGKSDDEDTAELKDLIASATEDMADLLTPDKEVITSFGKIARNYERDMREAKEDADAYEGAIEAHQESAEWYEYAQLAAEIGIVVASVALLLGSRWLWMVSIGLGLLCAGTLGYTKVHTDHLVADAQAKIRAAAENVQKLESDDDEDAEPDKGGGTRPAAEHPAHAPGAK
jgi:hypothetical protein